MKAAVAVSGGRDSLLALCLAVEAGYEVLACHGLFLPDSEPALLPLEQICAKLGVEFRVFDLREQFSRLVSDPFARAYALGLTPNPCAHCNRLIKFGLLFDLAAQAGAETMVTGHYARLETEGDSLWLAPAGDKTKDQGYFLSLVPRQTLARALFPLGTWRKSEVAAALSQRGIEIPLPGESQDVCFIAGNDYRAYLNEFYAKDAPPGGPILLDGREVGSHQGLWRYTLGQRKGLGVAHSEPLYVVAKDFSENALRVAEKARANCRGVKIVDVNYLTAPGQWPDRLAVRTAYRQVPAEAEVRVCESGLEVKFLKPAPLAAPGQIAVIYGLNGRAYAGGVLA